MFMFAVRSLKRNLAFTKKNPLFMPYFLLFCNMVQNTTRMQIQGYFRHQVAGYYKKLSNNTTKIYSTKKVNLLGECRMHVLRTAKFSLAQWNIASAVEFVSLVRVGLNWQIVTIHSSHQTIHPSHRVTSFLYACVYARGSMQQLSQLSILKYYSSTIYTCKFPI